MTTATATKIPDETALGEIVSASRAVKHLTAAGYETLGHVRDRGMAGIYELKYVGQVSIEELLKAIGPQEIEPEEIVDPEGAEFEESVHPLHLERTPSGPNRISWTPARKVGSPGGGHQVQRPIWIEFDERGRFELSQKMYWMRVFNRDVARVNEAIEAEMPWRQKCVDMLRRDFRAYGNGFTILSD